MNSWLLALFFGALTMSSVSSDDPVPTASISAHVLDISGGTPAENVQILAHIQQNDSWVKIGDQFTKANGRVDWVSPGFTLIPGTYRLAYLTKPYYKNKGIDSFYPYVEVFFEIKDATQHYHVPLTLSPWGYSTYRGS